MEKEGILRRLLAALRELSGEDAKLAAPLEDLVCCDILPDQ